jgi:hypothetical protein
VEQGRKEGESGTQDRRVVVDGFAKIVRLYSVIKAL